MTYHSLSFQKFLTFNNGSSINIIMQLKLFLEISWGIMHVITRMKNIFVGFYKRIKFGGFPIFYNNCNFNVSNADNCLPD